MKRLLKSYVAWLVVLQLILPWSVFAAPVGEFISVVGNVKLTRAGKDYKPAVRTPVEVKDVVVTAKGAKATLRFTDDSTIALAENSKFEITEYLLKGKVRKGKFNLAIGRLTADVKKFVGGQNSFDVVSPTATAGVRGTGFEFVVAMVGTQMTTTVTCTAGALSVSSLSAAGAIISTTTIVAGQAAIITSTGITVTTAAAASAGAGAAATTGTTVTTATGTGTVTTGAAAGTTAGAAGAGTAAGTATVAGVGAGTVAAGAVAAAAVAAAVAGTSSSSTTTHTATTHH